jgi:hypothetical protein
MRLSCHHVCLRREGVLASTLRHTAQPQTATVFNACVMGGHRPKHVSPSRSAPGLLPTLCARARPCPQVAERFQEGRVFLLGDAAHRFPPAGGFGMNTGVQDAHNIAWKLAAVVRGAASVQLLDSYTPERLPVAQANTRLSVANWHEAVRVPAALALDPRAANALAAAVKLGALLPGMEPAACLCSACLCWQSVWMCCNDAAACAAAGVLLCLQ